ncbi:MAG: acyl-CoA reductase [Sphingobacteriales bacterium 44-15]|nr:MAG: acyl-CoA reductase [Sphingobacteriales bacterium 44-15]
MNLQQRVDILYRLGDYMLGNDKKWEAAKETASAANPWFIPEFIDHAVKNIATFFLSKPGLEEWLKKYDLPSTHKAVKTVGITMAGNIPLVGFHDFLCTFVSGHRQAVRMSSKDNILLKHIFETLEEWIPEAGQYLEIREMLKGCDAYIATGSNNTARYFEYYFRKYPHIIRKNRTAVAVISGTETQAALEQLADDVYLYFGLGCRNVSKIFVPEGYDFISLLDAFRKYDHLIENHKYKHNYDYNLAMHIVNQKFYMTNGSILLSENPSVFSPISQLNYQYYTSTDAIYQSLNPEEIQAITGTVKTPFGTLQSPALADYADGIDTMQFLKGLS